MYFILNVFIILPNIGEKHCRNETIDLELERADTVYVDKEGEGYEGRYRDITEQTIYLVTQLESVCRIILVILAIRLSEQSLQK